MNILLIAGHGGKDCGACGNGYKEADLTREFVKILQNELHQYCLCDIADISIDWFSHINNGGKLDVTPYDYVLEIHFNSFNGTANGTEIFVTTDEKNTSVEDNIIKSISMLGFKNRGSKRKNFAVIKHIKKQGVSCALLEVCFIDNITDITTYQLNKDDIIHNVAIAILESFGIKVRDNMSKFNDIQGHYAEKHIDKLEQYGIVNGYEDGTFRPDRPVTRGQAAVMISNALTVMGK